MRLLFISIGEILMAAGSSYLHSSFIILLTLSLIYDLCMSSTSLRKVRISPIIAAYSPDMAFISTFLAGADRPSKWMVELGSSEVIFSVVLIFSLR